MNIDLLLEKYLTTVHVDWKNIDREVFVNPSKRDIKEMMDGETDNHGYRYLIDFKHKKSVCCWCQCFS